MSEERELTPDEFQMMLAIAWKYVVLFQQGELRVRFDHGQDSSVTVVAIRATKDFGRELQFFLLPPAVNW